MKRIICLLICLCLLLAGCGAPKTDPTGTDGLPATSAGNGNATNAPSADATESGTAAENRDLPYTASGDCTVVTHATPTRTTTDLMQMAIDASTFSDTGLNNLPVKTYGTGTFQDYYDLHANPLYSADYMLSATALAKQVKDADTFGIFFGEMLAHYGAKIEHKANTWNRDLDEALTNLFESAGDTANLEAAKAQAKTLDPQVAKSLAVFINAAAEANQTIKEQTAKAGKSAYTDLLKFQYYTMTAGDMESLAKMTKAYDAMDFKAVLTAGRDVVRAAGVLASELENVAVDTPVTINTPVGDIIIGGKESDTYNSPNALLLVDAGGNDTYNGRVASNSFENPISVLIDLGGNDTYTGKEATQGCGILGVGVLMDLGGSDTYTAKYMAQGCAIVGVGALYDQTGDDKYTCDVTTQAAAHYGMAVLADCAGNDAYKAVGLAQASAGNCGQAYLVDTSGNDTYYVSPQLEDDYLGLNYGGHDGWNGNNSQGCGWGQRNVETPLRGLSGGIAGLMDISGNDTYTGGLWVMGTGYWGGVGFLTDIGGDDSYESCYYSQSSVAHYGISLLADIGGNDRHALTNEGCGAGFGFVWDRGLGVFIEDGGNDTYVHDYFSGGSSWSEYDEKGREEQDMSYAIFIDTEGKDSYSPGDSQSYGYGRGGYFIDAGGTDDLDVDGTANAAGCVTDKTGQRGGVFIDYPGNDGEAHFWENAKAKYLG